MTEAKSVSPFFILGSPRTGTTLLRSIINAHADVAIPRETTFYYLFNAFLKKRNIGSLETRADFEEFWKWYTSQRRFTYLGIEPDGIYDQVVESGIYSSGNILTLLMKALAGKDGKQFWGEKTPGHETFIDKILQDFPEAKFLFTIRDPRGMAASMKKVPWGNRSTLLQVKIWKRSYAVYDRLKDDKRFLKVPFEELLNQPEKTVKGICGFMNLPYDDNMLKNRKLGSQSGSKDSWTDKYEQKVASKIDTQSISKWAKNLKPFEVRSIEKHCRNEMELLGYAATSEKDFSFPDRIREIAIYGRQIITNIIRDRFSKEDVNTGED